MGDESLTRRDAVRVLGVLAASPALTVTASAQESTTAIAPLAQPTILYPHESSTRRTRDLSGMWKFQLDPTDAGEAARWFDSGLPKPRSIPVPCSWNDLFDDARNYFGTSWYETELWIDAAWKGQRIHLRFGSAVYHAKVWLNGKLLGEHVGGHLPFAFDVTGIAKEGERNRLVVSVENRLEIDRVPAIPDPKTSRMHTVHFPQTTYDFFPYAGLHRPVLLFTTPAIHVHDVTVATSLNGSTGTVDASFTVNGNWTGRAKVAIDNVVANVEVRDGRGQATLRIPSVRAWSPETPFLYRLVVTLGDGADEYVLKIGIRTVEVKGSQILLNGKPVFLTGFGKHEDFPIHGRGLDLPVLVRDYELLRWIGANSFRTSHYPYAEEALQLADEYGLLVISETPGVSLVFSDTPAVIGARYQQLERATAELIQRDKNHASVIMWSLANEPLTKPFHTLDDAPADSVAKGTSFFTRLFESARKLDKTRPYALVSLHGGPNEWVGLGDVICTNSYNSWYAVSGRLEDGAATLDKDIQALRAYHGDKPIMFTEFGADAVAGMHAQPDEMWSEEYQADMIEFYWKTIKKYPYIVGAHPWAFADFKTPQSIMRVGALNHKGVFTRDRRPKLAAHRLRSFWAKA
ncbi:beta-glucuronidase [Roseiterribacter gracilis]|uniref:Beta-glucuronidase n=1 Tax=Roseiterribacter gracilis TaxID=2812848 RepID=A0A8S8XI18_9PROT|nr:beta-glucuronidase [Rhodospirillales bacterium TMPK1]